MNKKIDGSLCCYYEQRYTYDYCNKQCKCRCCQRDYLPIRNSVTVRGSVSGLESVVGVEISYTTNNQRFTVKTDDLGNYSIPVSYSSDLTIVPTNFVNYIVSPENYRFESVKSNKQECNFVYRYAEVTISGKVTGLDTISGVAIDYVVNGESFRTFTNSEGIYTFVVASGSNVEINPVAVTGYSIFPQKYEFTAVINSINNCDFTYYFNEIILTRATNTALSYADAPNTWPMHGDVLPNLYMMDKILIFIPPIPVASIKWEYGVRDISYFVNGGGTDITLTYQQGLPVDCNQQYTVYVLLESGYEDVATINIDNIRDGSTTMPYLLIGFDTIEKLRTEIDGIDQFSLFFMQGPSEKLEKHYEIYEDIDMITREWEPLGVVDPNYPYILIDGFVGSLSGNNHQISNLTLGNREDAEARALIAAAGNNAIIRDLKLTNCSVKSGLNGAGFVAFSFISNGGTILFENLHFSGNIDSLYAASICSYSQIYDGTLIINDCHTVVDIISVTYGGGISGFNYLGDGGNLSISNCTAAGHGVSTADDNAGIVAYCQMYGQTFQITNCFSSMELEGYSRLGGILASIVGEQTSAIISSCGNSGEIRSETSSGGITASLNLRQQLTCIVENCYNTGNIISRQVPSSWHCGGIVGETIGQATIRNCYNVGNVISSAAITQLQQYNGGIIARYYIVENCASIGEEVSGTRESVARISFYPAAITGGRLANNIAFDEMRVLISGIQKTPLIDTADGLDGLSVSSSELLTQNIYENQLGWDFENIWSFGNEEYQLPILRGIPAGVQPVDMPSHLL